MIITITSVEQGFTKNGDEFKKITGATDKGQQTTKSVFNNLKDKWELLQVNAVLEFQLEQKGQFWNVVDINTPALPSPQPLPDVPLHPDEEPIPTPPPDPTRKSIERQKSLDVAERWCSMKAQKGEDIKVFDVLVVAKMFESYLENGIVAEKKK